jgi:hypothetical protein
MTAKELKTALKAMCPNCDGSGCIPNGVIKSNFSQDEDGNCIEAGTYIEWEQEQCEWCHYFDTKLQDFSEQLCREQREIIIKQVADELYNRYRAINTELTNKIETAPMPEL